MTVDPTNPEHLVAAIQQDRWNDGGDNGNTAAVSTDGGAHWSLAAGQPAFTICSGATSGSTSFFNRASDPWVSFSSDGNTVYQSSLAFNANGPAFGGASSIQVSTSTDGGNHWNAPVAVKVDQSTTVLNDKESVTADPVNASTAYVVWDRLVSPSVHANPTAFLVTPAFRGPAWFAKTTDGGKTWSPGGSSMTRARRTKRSATRLWSTAGPAQGTLIDGFLQILTKGGKGTTPPAPRPTSPCSGRPTAARPGWRRSSSASSSTLRSASPGRPCAPATLCPASLPTRSTATCTPCGRTAGSARTGRPRSPSPSPPTAA